MVEELDAKIAEFDAKFDRLRDVMVQKYGPIALMAEKLVKDKHAAASGDPKALEMQKRIELI